MTTRLDWDADAQREAVRRELCEATPEEWAVLEGHALGRVLDKDPPTEPERRRRELADTPTSPLLPDDPPDWARQALRHEGLGLSPYDSIPAPDALPFPPLDTLVLSRDTLDALLRRSSLR
jgi:hypothetical protein